jgi:hypothetical protein
MNLLNYLKNAKIENLGYDSVYVEKPVSKLIDFDWKKILNAPPSNLDKSTIRELELISRETKNRSKLDKQHILAIDQELDDPFIKVLNLYNLEYPQRYIDLFYDIVQPLLKNTKSFWNRPRPNQLAEFFNITIDVMVTETHHSGSYPSGHTVYASLVANILKDMHPQLDNKKLDKIVLDVAEARVKQGVHYPSDNKASIIFSKFVFDKLNPKLRKYRNEQI